MRTEQEMLKLMLDVAEADPRIRAVCMNGSRTNPNAPKDMFRDYDVVYLVTDMEPYLRDKTWVDVFGKRLIMQTPEDMALFPPELGDRFTYLMLFEDGTRIDLMLIPIEEMDEYIREDHLTVILLDKDDVLPEIPAPSDKDYHIMPPEGGCFDDCCNEFWWVATYVAKGLWRHELPYAKRHLDLYVRDMLEKMLAWQIGFEHGFSVSVGKCGKYLERYLSAEDWNALLKTYSDGDYDNTWEALLDACDLFDRTAEKVAARLGTIVPEYGEKVRPYLEHIRQLPEDAREIC